MEDAKNETFAETEEHEIRDDIEATSKTERASEVAQVGGLWEILENQNNTTTAGEDDADASWRVTEYLLFDFEIVLCQSINGFHSMILWVNK